MRVNVDALVLMVCVAGAVFYLGVMVGYHQSSAPRTCPEYQKEKVAYTVEHPDGSMTCAYTRTTYGKAVRKERL